MNAVKSGLIVMSFSFLFTGLSHTAEVEWTGTVNSSWDTTTANWWMGGAPATFAVRDHTCFTDAAVNRSVTAGNLAVGRIVFSNDAAYVLNGGGSAQIASGVHGLQEVPRFEKWGSGKLTITGFHSFTGDVWIAEGCVETATPKGDLYNAVSSALGNPRTTRKVTVSTNAVLSFFGQGPTGAGTSPIDVKMAIEVCGGTLNLQTNFATTLGNVLFDNAAFVYAGGSSVDWRTMAFNGDWLKFSGTNVYTFPWVAGNQTCGLSIGRAKPVDVHVADITGNAASDVIWQLPVVRINRTGDANNPGRFIKKGSGTLDLACGHNTFTGNVRVVEGTLACSAGFAEIGGDKSGLGSPLYAHSIYVGTNAVLALKGNDLQGQFYNNSRITIHIDCATLSQDNKRVNGFGPLILENAVLSYSGRNDYYGEQWPTFGFNGPVTFKGTNAYTLANNSGSAVLFGGAGMSDVIVDDITQNTNADVTISMPIVNGLHWYHTADGQIKGTNLTARPAQFRKKGTGTLALNAFTSSFTGNVEVAEGVLELITGGSTENTISSAIGNPRVSRRVTVYGGGELSFRVWDALGQLASLITLETVISNSTFRLADNSANGIGPITFYDGQFIYNGGGAGSRLWGTLGFTGRVTLDGTAPYHWPVIGSNNRFSLGYADDFSIEPRGDGKTNYWGKTTFDVRDITQSSAVDATIGVPFQNIPDWPGASVFKNILFKCGLIKAGAGTLNLTSADNTFEGGTRIVAGTLRVDGALKNSEVTVEAGGWLGGTGIVTRVTVQTGAGFEVFADQTDPLQIGTFAAAGGGVVRVRNPGGLAREALRVPFARVTSFEGSFDARQWTVVMDGVQASPSLNVANKNGILEARWAPGGTLIAVH